jgi:excisionase family DNA binding protein
VSISTIRAWVRQGHIPKSTYIKIGNTYRFNKTSVTEALTSTAKEAEQAEIRNEPVEEQLEFDFDADVDV